MPAFAVDQHPEKAKIVEQIIAGLPTRTIAVSVFPPLHFNAIQRYRTCVVRPMLARAEHENRIVIGGNGKKRALTPLSRDPKAIQTVQQSIQDAPALSIFRQRLETLHGRIDRGLDRAEAEKDISPLAPLLNQAHKNLEMLGRATGELEQSTGTGVSIQIVCPWAADRENMPRVSFANDTGEGQFDATDLFETVKIVPTA